MKFTGNRINLGIVFAVVLTAAMLFATVFFWTPQTGSAYAEAPQNATLQVGVARQNGLSELNGDERVGYTYDFLEELAQYTGWNFVFEDGNADESVFAQQKALAAKLAAGEIDVLGGLRYDAALAGSVEYTTYNYGTAYRVFCAGYGNGYVTNNWLHSGETVRIVSLTDEASGSEPGENAAVVKRYFGGDESRYTLRFTESEAELKEAVNLEAGNPDRADVALCWDSTVPENTRIIGRFAPAPLYFAFSAGAREKGLVGVADNILMRIAQSKPGFAADLYDTYFVKPYTRLFFTDIEKAYIASAPVLKVLFDPKKAPIQYVMDGQVRGIAADIFDYIASVSGLKFEYVDAGSQSRLTEMLIAREGDIAAALPCEREICMQYGVALTRPYLSCQMVMVVNDKIDYQDMNGKRLALPAGVKYTGVFAGTVDRYDEISDCLTAVSTGRADYTYGNGYSVQYYLNNYSFKNTLVIPQSEIMQEIGIGIVKPVNLDLVAVLNKCLSSMSESTLQTLIYRNTVYSPHTRATFSEFINDNAVGVVIFLVGLLAVLIGSALTIVFLQRRARRTVALQNERFMQLAALSGEYLFEYDIRADLLTLSEKSAAFFGGERVRKEYARNPASDSVSDEKKFYERLLIEKQGTEELKIPMPDGVSRWLRITCTVICDKEDRPVSCIGKVADIQTQKEDEARLIEKSRRDSLTELYNAAACRKEITLRLETAGKGALMVLDMDGFKEVNDRYGHYTGDAVLAAAAGALRQIFGEDDVLCRVGGDEFVVFLSSVRAEEAVLAAYALLKEKMSAVQTESLPLGAVTVSAGAALVMPGDDYDSLFRRADQALYRVKGHGKNSISIDKGAETGDAYAD